VGGYVAVIVAVIAGAALLLFLARRVEKHIPRRYRRHSTGQIAQTLDHRHGRFGGTYQEDLIRRELPAMGRNERCSCGSGKKYKRCCGVNAF
jgi:uncharacterized protein YecA (UPF0149 family)